MSWLTLEVGTASCTAELCNFVAYLGTSSRPVSPFSILIQHTEDLDQTVDEYTAGMLNAAWQAGWHSKACENHLDVLGSLLLL